MQSRGRPPKDPAETKASQISVRLTADLVARLDEAAKQNRLSRAEEISRRLERSFTEEGRIEDVFGGRETYAFLKLVAQAFSMLRQSTGQTWHRDRFTFDHALVAMTEIFGYFRPSGSRRIPSDLPMLEHARANGLKTGPMIAQARKFPFGKLAGRMAVFLLETAPVPGEEAMDQQREIFRRIATDLRMRLTAPNQAQTDLVAWGEMKP